MSASSTSFVAKLQVVIPALYTKYGETLAKFMRFCLVGCLNSLIDLAIFSLLAWKFPTSDVRLLLLYNSLGSITASINSFYWNKYWTFRAGQATTLKEVLSFIPIALGSMAMHDVIILGVAQLFPIFTTGGWLWANGLKICAIVGTMLLSFFGMHLWVFTRKAGHQQSQLMEDDLTALPTSFKHSLSVILPAYNEEAAIAGTVRNVVDTLSGWLSDFEVIVVNDGSKDRTQEIVETIVAVEPRVHLINHTVNQGCGAALVTGFEQASKKFAFYMDSDGQFDINDLRKFFPLVEEYDGVFGYRIDRQDTWMRKLNAWGWNRIVRYVFGLQVHDIDCAFKLFNAHFFRTNQLEARGALLLTEIVYKFARSGYTYTQVGVRHLPRHGGNGTGAKISVILRAFAELFFYASKWYREENEAGLALQAKRSLSPAMQLQTR